MLIDKQDKKPKAANHLSNISVVEVSLCGTPMVPDATIAVIKARNPGVASGAAYQKHISFHKVDVVKKQVYAYVLVPDEPDWEGDVVSAENVEKACHGFLKNMSAKQQKGTGTGLNHEVFDDIGNPIESSIDRDGATGRSLGITNPVDKGWLLGIQVTNDEIWKKIEDGEINGFSMGGLGTRTPIEEKSIDDGGVVAKAVEKLLNKFGFVRLSKEAMDFDTTLLEEQVWDILPTQLDALWSSLVSILYDEQLNKEGRVTAVKESLDQFRASILETFGGTEKQFNAMKSIIDGALKSDNKSANKGSGAKKSTEMEGVLEMEITQEQLTKMITDAMEPIKKELTEFKDDVGKKLEETTKQIGEFKKSLDDKPKLEETEFGKKVTEDIKTLAKGIDEIVTRTVGSKAATDIDPEKTKKGDEKPANKSTDDLEKNIVDTAYSFRKSQ